MNHRAALKAMLQGDYPEDVCQFEWGYWPETVARWQQEGMPLDQDPWEAAGITRYDRVPVNVRFCPPLESKIISETADTQVVRDHEGITKEISKHGTAFPRFLEHPVSTPEDFARIRPHLEASAPGRYPDDWSESVARLAQRNHVLVMGKVEISFFGWHRDLMGLENLLIAYFEQPALIHAISEQHLHFLKEIYEPILREVEFDFIFMWEDMSFKNGPLLSPKMVKEFMLPYYHDFISWAKGFGDYKVLVDSDGDVRQLIPLFLDAGVDGLLPFECSAGMNICDIRRDYPEMIIAGGIDKRELGKGREAIDRELESKLPFMFHHRRYLPSLDHHVPPEVPYADFLYYLEKSRELWRQGRV